MFSGIDCAMIATEMIQAAVKERYNITLDAKLGTSCEKYGPAQKLLSSKFVWNYVL